MVLMEDDFQSVLEGEFLEINPEIGCLCGGTGAQQQAEDGK
jgi:hypothetical protein